MHLLDTSAAILLCGSSPGIESKLEHNCIEAEHEEKITRDVSTWGKNQERCAEKVGGGA
jgi:hypothetical protein